MSISTSAPTLFILDFKDGGKPDDVENASGAGRIAFGSATGGELRTLIDHQRLPDGIDLLTEDGGRLIWTQMGNPDANDGVVQSAKLSGSEPINIFSNGEIHTPKQCIVDAVNRKLYVCDREGMRVHRSNLDGSNQEVLVQRGDFNNPDHVKDKTRWCVGICVDPKRRKFYWTQKGPSKSGQGHIFRANIDMPQGETAETRTDVEMLFEKLPEPIDLEIDAETETLYWTDRGAPPKGNTLNKVNVSGTFEASEKREYQILANHLQEAIGLKIDHVNSHIYVTDLSGTAYRYNMDGSNCEKLFINQGAYTGIALAHLDRSQIQSLYGSS